MSVVFLKYIYRFQTSFLVFLVPTGYLAPFWPLTPPLCYFLTTHTLLLRVLRRRRWFGTPVTGYGRCEKFRSKT